MAEVGIAIDSRSADVHADEGRVERMKLFLLPRQRVIDMQFAGGHLRISVKCKETKKGR
jgi:hypothetical protein